MPLFVVALRYEIPDYSIDTGDGVAVQHPNGVKVLIGHRDDGTPSLLTETDHDDQHGLELMGAFVPQSDAEDDDPELVSFMDEIRHSHRLAAREIVGNLRWLLARPGGHLPVGRRLNGLYRVRGEDEWRPLPMRRGAPTASLMGVIPIDESWRSFIQDSTRRGWSEPVAHVILREARQQVEANPRSATVLVMTALEVGLDQQENRLSWPNRRKPPKKPPPADVLSVIHGDVGHLIRQARGLEQTRWIELPDWAADRIGWGRKTRNAVVHDAAQAPERQRLLELIRTVQDVLYLLDFQAGHDWAKQFVGYPTGDSEQVFGTLRITAEMSED